MSPLITHILARAATIATLSLAGIAVVKAYFLLFTAPWHICTTSLVIFKRERLALLIRQH